ncbi:MAG: sugar-binding protein, partial [Chitinophagaceae bacterium]
MRNFLLLAFACLFSGLLSAQKKNAAYQLQIRQTTDPIKIDGIIDEPGWANASIARDFYMVNPMDTSYARVKTEVAMTYDHDNLYLYAICYNSMPGPYMVQSLRRDFDFVKNDNFLVFLDPFEDQTNGLAFGTNAAGAQWDGIMYEGGRVDLSWENKWVSEVKQYSDRWVLEMAIPFKTLRYKKGLTRWGVNFSRNDLKTTEKSSWAPVPRQFPTASLAYTGTLVWDQAPPQPGANISLIPYALGGISKNYQPATARTYRRDVGLDAKVAITSSLNLDLTVNPDFSQV